MWPNRDPLGERGGINLFGFVRNDPEDNEDPSGLALIPGSSTGRKSPQCPPGTHPGFSTTDFNNNYDMMGPPNGFWWDTFFTITGPLGWYTWTAWYADDTVGSALNAIQCVPNKPPCPPPPSTGKQSVFHGK